MERALTLVGRPEELVKEFQGLQTTRSRTAAEAETGTHPGPSWLDLQEVLKPAIVL